MKAFYTYASLTTANHSDIDAICNGLDNLDIKYIRNPQTVIVSDVTLKIEARINMNADDWTIANHANLLASGIH